MREIRFRAWDSANAKMLDWDTIKNHLIMPGHSGWEWLQYTGLVDRSGKEIYESDRIKTPAGIGIVKWDKCFCLFWNDRDFTTLHDCMAEQLEVIGDIYSTPELLKVKP